jgi:transposase
MNRREIMQLGTGVLITGLEEGAAAQQNEGDSYFEAPCVFDGPINGTCFRAWVEQFLVPTIGHGDIVIMDNLPAHKVAGIKEAIEHTGAELLYLPPYSPDLNPIEQVFAKIKALLRTAATRSITALWNEIGKCIDAFSAHECASYLRHAGYSV